MLISLTLACGCTTNGYSLSCLNPGDRKEYGKCVMEINEEETKYGIRRMKKDTKCSQILYHFKVAVKIYLTADWTLPVFQL